MGKELLSNLIGMVVWGMLIGMNMILAIVGDAGSSAVRWLLVALLGIGTIIQIIRIYNKFKKKEQSKDE